MQKEIKEYTGKLSKIKYTFSEIIHNHRHYLLLLYWPLFGLAFNIAESGKFTGAYHLIRCGLDERIPFCEYFVIPYILWFAFVALTCAYTLFFEKDVFVRYMKFIIIGYTVAIIAFSFTRALTICARSCSTTRTYLQAWYSAYTVSIQAPTFSRPYMS